jgi:hypothetical protein
VALVGTSRAQAAMAYAGDAENSAALIGRHMRDPVPPISGRRFLVYLAIIAATGVLALVLVAVLFHHGPVPK